MGTFIDLTGKKYGRLTVLKRGENRGKHTTWLCKCDCSNLTTVEAGNLKNGHIQSCGCFKKESVTKRKMIHGGVGTRLYHTWKHINQRCNNVNDKQYPDYGGRGIKLCIEWQDFGVFMEWAIKNGYKDNLTIDRVDNNGNYEPNNCRWATNIEQARNKRNNHIIEFNGQKKTLAEWAEIYKLSRNTLLKRITTYGWSIEKALSTPI